MGWQDRFRYRGHTLLEWGVVASVLGALLAVFLFHIPQYQEEAEQVQVKYVLAAVRTALAARAAQLGPEKGEIGLRALAEQNPIGLLIDPPRNYLGEFYRPNIGIVSHGNWYFDWSDKTLVYFPNKPKRFSSKPSKFLRFKVKFLRLSNSASNENLRAINAGLALEKIE